MDKQKKYTDIINLCRPPVPAGHPRMSVQNRAKIFSPFAALRGYEGEIEEENKKNTRISKPGLSEEDRERLTEKIHDLYKGEQIRMEYFKPDPNGQEEDQILGACVEISGTVDAVDITFGRIKLNISGNFSFDNNGFAKDPFVEIPFEDILTIEDIG